MKMAKSNKVYCISVINRERIAHSFAVLKLGKIECVDSLLQSFAESKLLESRVCLLVIRREYLRAICLLN